jgi:hypothetical protein
MANSARAEATEEGDEEEGYEVLWVLGQYAEEI